MRSFRLYFFLTCSMLLFSCRERDETTGSPPDVVERRLLAIQEVKKLKPSNSILYYDFSITCDFFEVTLKNVSNFDLQLHYLKKYPLWVMNVEYITAPTTSEIIFWEDTSRTIKRNEEFMVYVPLRMTNSAFYLHEFQGIQFQVLISSSNDLSFYFESNPAKPIYKMRGINEGKKEYGYPLEFTYWATTGLFWERYLLE